MSVLAATIALALCSTSATTSSATIPATLVLVDADGGRIRLAAGADTPALVVLGRLAEIDSLRARIDAAADAGLSPGRDYRAYVVSVDADDGPEEAQAARAALGVRGWSVLTGECDSALLLARVLSGPSVTAVLRRDGRVFRILGMNPSGAEIRSALADAGGSARPCSWRWWCADSGRDDP